MSKEERMETALESAFAPLHLEVHNESHMHNVAPGAESHFKVVLVSESFEGKSLIARHRAINAVVSMEEYNIHALALHTFSPNEWSPESTLVQSPDCLGGSKS